jgi:hypothetical protein
MALYFKCSWRAESYQIMMWDVQTPCTMVGMSYSESVIATLIALKSIEITSNTENKLQL